MPSSTAALRYEKSVRIGNMQRAVVTALQSSSPDPIAESEITHQFVEYLTKVNVNDTQQMEILTNLESTFPIKSQDVTVFVSRT